MADEPKGSVWDDVLFVVGGLAILVALWFFSGGPEKADLRGIFLSPPAPLGTGEAYGPTLGGESTTTMQSVVAPPSF